MARLLKATDKASEQGLATALMRAAESGSASTVETLLGALTERFPDANSAKTAERALRAAAAAKRWPAVAYLAQYLADTTAEVHGGVYQPYDEEVAGAAEDEIIAGMEEVWWTAGGEPSMTTPITPITPKNNETAFIMVFEGMPPEIYGSAERPNRGFSLGNPELSLAGLQDATEKVVPRGEITVVATVPPEVAGDYRIATDGSRKSLAEAVSALYSELCDANNVSHDLNELDLVSVVRDDNKFALNVVSGPQ